MSKINKMNINDKIKLNKLIRTYTGDNTFIVSLQKQLKSNKYLSKEPNDKGKEVRVLSEKQYQVAESILQNS